MPSAQDPAAAFGQMGLGGVPPLAAPPDNAVREGDYHVIEFTGDMG